MSLHSRNARQQGVYTVNERKKQILAIVQDTSFLNARFQPASSIPAERFRLSFFAHERALACARKREYYKVYPAPSPFLPL